ncbi:PREDICTED: uncharacterized protein LOC109243706 [Nicotiana attenuata]|uniref:uncharacterized protein LOC109243706 n=1 Tax=Nicotiana attenuata TaxID=49451 RepID=UPI0009048C5E|nr:PREDICTED: uncharacterized protein LOC109243706 [Nicotiana attenuata]
MTITPFDGTSYGSWRRNILVALSVRNKLDFINGTTEKPPVGSPLVRQWQRCNDLVVSWLTNSLTKEISHSVEYSELAKDIWHKLEERCMADGARIFELKEELSHISQASISVNHLSVCTCGGNKKVEEEQKVYQFLMGLNDTYLQVRSNILMIKPLPSMSTIYGILLSDEKQRQVSSISQFPSNSNSASFNAGVSKQSLPSKVNFNPQRPDNQRSSLICKYCKKPGHSIEKCYKLHGFPQNFKFTKGNTPRRTAAHVEVQTPVNSDETGNAGGLSQISASFAAPNLLASANFAGKLLPENDSTHSLVSLPNGYKVRVTNIGSLTLSPDLTLHNVLYVPSFQHNLISVYKLVEKPGDIVQFTNTACTLQGPSLKKPVVLGRPDNGLYKLFQLPANSGPLCCHATLPNVFPCYIPCNPSSTVFPSAPSSTGSLSIDHTNGATVAHIK